MKTKLLTLSVVILITMSFTSSSNQDNCGSYFPLIKGTKWVYNEYDKKDKLNNISTMLIKEVKSVGDKTEYNIHVKSENPKPKKDEEPFERDLIYYCQNGIIGFDMSSFVPKEYEEMEITMEQKHLTIPATLKEGQSLDDAQVIVFVNGMQMMKIDITDRKVEKFEDVTTEAGNFKCALITSKIKSKVAFMTVNSSDKQWISPKAGQVMAETYDKNGKKMSSRKLVEFSMGY